mmetsp:Transcript_58389/g.126316  ORF Transcript_58389/g.126316 Transcript_58389/m.126316 type:complete len:294 (+) Transcript_58389:694-1575(+)
MNEAVKPGELLALRSPSRSAWTNNADSRRPEGGVGVLPDVQVALDRIVRHVLVIVGGADLDLANRISHELADGDNVPVILLQPCVHYVLTLLLSVASSSNLGSEALSNRLLASVQQNRLVQAVADLLQSKGLGLHLRPRKAIQDPAHRLCLMDLGIHELDDDLVLNEVASLQHLLQLPPSPEDLPHVDVTDVEIRGKLLAVLRAADAWRPYDTHRERRRRPELVLQKSDGILRLLDDDLSKKVREEIVDLMALQVLRRLTPEFALLTDQASQHSPRLHWHRHCQRANASALRA